MLIKIKTCIAKILCVLRITDLVFQIINKLYKGKYIRVINYHHVYSDQAENFDRNIVFLKKYFCNVTFHELNLFFEKKVWNKNKPGIIFTFDDGYEDNYNVAFPILNKHEMTGYFMVSSDLVGKKGYMSVNQLKEMVNNKHVIGSHTCTHHRMNKEDSQDILEYEIISSKDKLQRMLNCPIDIFCWCGGEYDTYTSSASIVIKKAGYKYSFMTNSYPVSFLTDKLHIQRTNIETDWSDALIKFQISGILDLLYFIKRRKINILTKSEVK